MPKNPIFCYFVNSPNFFVISGKRLVPIVGASLKLLCCFPLISVGGGLYCTCMTSASELFHNRRFRFGRSSSSFLDLGGGGGGGEQETPLDSSSHSQFHRNTSRRHRHLATHHHHGTATSTAANTRRDHYRPDLDGCDPLPRRAPHQPRHHPPHRPFLPDREPGWLDQGSSPATEDVNNSRNGSIQTGRLRSAGNERLPGTVLLARERLLQRLRGVSLSTNRQRNRASSSIHHNDFTIEDDIRLADVGDWENEISREWLAGTISFADNLSVEKSKRPPGLTQEALDSLQVEIFSKLNRSNDEITSSRLEECSICLESFLEGDKLIYLTCGHRFHFYCLDPWVRICGDCPNCRKAVLMSNCRANDI